MTKRGRKPLDLNLDWSLPNRALARKHMISVPTVRKYRKLRGAKSHRAGGLHASVAQKRDQLVAKWSAIDWSKQDSVISREMNCTRENVRQWRMKLGKPKSPSHRQCTDPEYLHNRQVVETTIKLNGAFITDASLSRKLGVPHALVSTVRRSLGVDRFDRDGYMELVDWNLSNKDLGRIWKRSAQLFANFRSQNQKGAPKYEIRFGRYPTNDRNYHQAMNAQMDASAKWHKEHGQ